MSLSKEMSPFAQSALALDFDFSELDRLSGQLERCSLESDQDFEHARKLLAAFADAGQRIGIGLQLLAKNLEEARQRAEKAATIVSNRAEAIKARQEASNQMLGRFLRLADRARG